MPRQPVTAEVSWTFETDHELDDFLAALAPLLDDPTAYLNLLKGVIRSTLMEAYRRRFLEGIPRMVSMEKETGGAPTDEKARLTKKIAELEQKHGQAAGDPARQRALRLQMQKLTVEYAGGSSFDLGDATVSSAEITEGHLKGLGSTHAPGFAHATPEEAGAGELGAGALATGQFRRRINDVLDLLTDAQHIVTTTDGDGNLLIGIGDIAVLDAITTPSYADPIGGGKSKYSILWRQLEFGTGVYAKPSPRLGPTQFKTGRGTWWFGPSNVRQAKFSGVHLRGSRPANFIRTASGIPYESDALLFRQAFYTEMSNRLFKGS